MIQDIIARVTPASRHLPSNNEEPLLRHRGISENKRKTWMSLFFVLGGAILVLALFLLFSSAFSRVMIKITTTKKVVSLNEAVLLNRDGSSGAIKYNLMKFKDSESVTVPITGTKVIQRPASGYVTIYNSYSATAQKLVVGTRLETADAKIYKILKAVSVPGTSVVNGKIIPGFIEVSIKASLPGEKYNSSPTDFTIPGFKGTLKYAKIFAKSSKNIVGGFSGETKISSAADIQKARVKLQETIRQKLTKDALVKVPEGFLLYTDAIFINFSDNSADSSSLISTGPGGGTLNVDGVLNAIILNSEDLKKFIVSKKFADLSGDASIVIKDIDKLSLEILNKDKINISSVDSIMTKISGSLPVAWDFDENSLKNKLVGIQKSKYQDVFKGFSVIEKAEVVFSPSWALYFPGDVSRIQIDKRL